MKYIVVLIASLLLAGCYDNDSENDPIINGRMLNPSDINQAKTYFEQQLDNTLAEAKKLNDPFDAYILLVKAYYGADTNRDAVLYKVPSKNFILRQSHFIVSDMIESPDGNDKYAVSLGNKKAALTDLFTYLDASLQTGNKKAFIELYESKKSYFDGDKFSLLEVEKLQIKYSAAFKQMAESLTVGDPIDEDLIMMYAYQYKKGFVYPKNTEKASTYYQKLYPTNKAVALYIISAYLEINDFENAYFWKVRCIDSCANMYAELYTQVEKKTNVADIFREKLNSTQFKEIETAANDPARTSFK